MREGSNSDLLFVFSIDDSKQNATSLLTPVSNIVFDVLSSGTLGFARAIRREDPPLQPESPYGPIWTNDKKIDSPRGGSGAAVRDLLQEFLEQEEGREQNNGPGGSAESGAGAPDKNGNGSPNMRTSTLFKTPQEGAPKERLGAELPGHFTTPTRPFLVDSPIRSRAPAQGDNNMDELNISFGNLSVSGEAGGEGVAQASASPARQMRSGERSQRGVNRGVPHTPSVARHTVERRKRRLEELKKIAAAKSRGCHCHKVMRDGGHPGCRKV